MRVTEFGILLRKIRLDNNCETATSMAGRLGISTAYLSAIELGKKTISTKTLTKLINIYNLNEELQKELYRLMIISQPVLTIPVTECNINQKLFALKLSDRLKNLTDLQIGYILEIMKGDN